MVYRILQKIKRSFFTRQLLTPRYCPVCDNILQTKFSPLDPKYLHSQKKHGFLYDFDDAEMLNYQEYKCPVCGANDRDRLSAMYFRKVLKRGVKRKVLDIAPALALKKFLQKNEDLLYRSADLAMEGVDDQVNIEEMIIYPDGAFDIFICSHVLEHVNDDVKALKELRRILSLDGWGVLMVPIPLKLKEIDEDPSVTDTSERWKRFGQDDHVRLYSKFGFINRVKGAGFTLEQCGISYFGKKAFERCGIEKKSVLYIVKK